MDLLERIKVLAARIEQQKDNVVTEEGCKNAFVMPFLNVLGYDVFDPDLVVPEFTADVGVKKGEKVDYAIKLDGMITTLVECKACAVDLATQHTSQLYRYFSVTDARIAILTNRIQYWFYSDLDETNRMDQRPFFEFDILHFQPSHIAELSKFTRDQFRLESILSTASNLKYSSAIQKEFAKEIEDPSEDLIRLFAARVYDGRFTKAVKEEFAEIVKVALRETIRELVNRRLTSALEVTSEKPKQIGSGNAEPGDGIVTTDEELEGFYIVRSIVRTTVKADRVIMRDAKSYCAIILDDNNRKPIARLHLNRSIKYIGLFSNRVEEKIRIDSLDDIYQHADRLLQTVLEYEAPA